MKLPNPGIRCLISVFCPFISALPVCAQDYLGTAFGFPNSSPPIQWPRGMSREALDPANLYPNGAQFGLSNTSGGFGSAGTSQISGVGLAERALPFFQQEELRDPFAYNKSLNSRFHIEQIKSTLIFNRALSSALASQRTAGSSPAPGLYAGGAGGQMLMFLPKSSSPEDLSTDGILKDPGLSTDAILRTGF